MTEYEKYVGKRVRKIFYPKNSKQAEWFTGTIKLVALKKGCNPKKPNYVCKIRYEDGDEEVVECQEASKLLVPDHVPNEALNDKHKRGFTDNDLKLKDQAGNVPHPRKATAGNGIKAAGNSSAGAASDATRLKSSPPNSANGSYDVELLQPKPAPGAKVLPTARKSTGGMIPSAARPIAQPSKAAASDDSSDTDDELVPADPAAKRRKTDASAAAGSKAAKPPRSAPSAAAAKAGASKPSAAAPAQQQEQDKQQQEQQEPGKQVASKRRSVERQLGLASKAAMQDKERAAAAAAGTSKAGAADARPGTSKPAVAAAGCSHWRQMQQQEEAAQQASSDGEASDDDDDVPLRLAHQAGKAKAAARAKGSGAQKARAAAAQQELQQQAAGAQAKVAKQQGAKRKQREEGGAAGGPQQAKSKARKKAQEVVEEEEEEESGEEESEEEEEEEEEEEGEEAQHQEQQKGGKGKEGKAAPKPWAAPFRVFPEGQEPYRQYPGIEVAYDMELSRASVERVAKTQKLYFNLRREYVASERERVEAYNKERREQGLKGKARTSRPDRKTAERMKMDGSRLVRSAKGGPAHLFGHVPGIAVNDQFVERNEMLVLGLHQAPMGGIVPAPAPMMAQRTGGAVRFPCAVSISMSGGYLDNVDKEQQEGGFWYTGEGGNDLLGNRRQLVDQKMSKGNLGMILAYELGTPVRVLRKNPDPDSDYKQVFFYDGLYRVTAYRYVLGDINDEEGKRGKKGKKPEKRCMVFQFFMQRLKGQPARKSGEVVFGKTTSSQRAQWIKSRPGVVCHDMARGQEGRGVMVFNDLSDLLPPHLDTQRDKDILLDCAKRKYVNADRPCKYITQNLYPDDFPAELRPKQPVRPTTVRAGTTPHAWIASLNQGGMLPYRQSTNNKASLKQGPLVVMTSRDPVHLITECGDFCGCKDKACPQRPVQQGLRFQLEVYLTPDKGWGVRTWTFIPAGAFVVAFPGLVRRNEQVSDEHDDTYFFDMAGRTDVDKNGRRREADGHVGQFTVDALDYGNVGRYINHSCQPNLYVQPAVVGHADPEHPLICFFAGINIPAGTDLTYDYGSQYVEVNLGGQCRCGSRLCIGKQ